MEQHEQHGTHRIVGMGVTLAKQLECVRKSQHERARRHEQVGEQQPQQCRVDRVERRRRSVASVMQRIQRTQRRHLHRLHKSYCKHCTNHIVSTAALRWSDTTA
jgi:hypothetical protein